MGKYSTGLDETDVMAMMNALQAVHSGRVELKLSPRGPGSPIGVMVELSATFDVVDGSRLPAEVRIENPYPCKDHSTLLAHIYDGLYRLDAAIQRAYEQRGLIEV